MWNEQKTLLTSQLSAGEPLLWSGEPRQGIYLRPSDALLIPSSLMWCGFAIFWETGVWFTNAPFFFRLWGIPFVLIGLYMVIGRFFVDSKARSKTYYGVTNERVIFVSGIFSKKVKSLSLRTLTDLSLEEKADQTGTITFGPKSANYQWPFGRQNEADTASFESIREAKRVYEIIRNAQKNAV